MTSDHKTIPFSSQEILKAVFDHADATVIITSESGELVYKNRDSADLLFDSA